MTLNQESITYKPYCETFGNMFTGPKADLWSADGPTP